MFDELDRLSVGLGVISRDEAKRVCETVNRKLMDLVSAQVIKLYWVGEAEDGVLLTPMAFINNMRGEEDPKPFQVTAGHKGILPWVYRTRSPLWLEDLRKKDLSKAVRNQVNQAEVPADFLDMRESWLDSMMVVPLTVRGDVRGLFSIEYGSSGRLKPAVLELVNRLARPIACLLWDSDVHAYNQERTSNAVSQFLSDVGTFAFDSAILEGDERSGFIARPFADDHAEVERRIASLLGARGVRARAYQPEGGDRYIVDDIQRQIRHSHFCIVDLTGLNTNVIAEVGMMIVMRKHFMLLRKRGDLAEIPFNLSQYPFYDYEVGSGRDDLRVWNTPLDQFEPFDGVMDRFIARLPESTGFSSAREFRSDGDR